MNFPEQDDLPSLDVFREKVLRHLASLLESHVHSWVFGEEVGAFINRENRELDALLDRCESASDSDAALAAAARRCRDVRSALSMLVRERQRQWKENGDELRGLMLDFNRLVSELQQTLIDKDLLERQSQVLRNIILSHERITQWKEFVQEILSDFYKFFPFQLFFIVFTEEHGLSLNLYYMGEVGEETRHNARQRLSREMLARLGLPKDAMLDIEEFQVLEGHALDALDGVDLLTVAVPETLPNRVGVLGVGYASSEQRGAREREFVRAFLAVMGLVVGASRA
ncbi:MAG: GGDEF-domain containing protein, partial [Sulfuricellaceae bacterium]